MARTFSRFRGDRSGATNVEYGIIAALISVALISGAKAVGVNMTAMFNVISTAVLRV
jgi:pilus assembly protein Flp/PilA